MKTESTIERWQSLSRDPLVSIRQIESVTGCDPTTIRRWIAQGKLLGTRLHGRGQWRCRQSQVLSLIKELECNNG